MTNPGDLLPDGKNSSPKEGLPLRKVAMLQPGFREEMETSVLRPRILGIRPPSDSRDRRNLKFAGIALLVSLLMFGILEYKQLREASRDVKSSTMSLFDKK